MSTDLEHTPLDAAGPDSATAEASPEATQLSAAWLRENHEAVVRTLAVRYCGRFGAKPNRQQRREAMAHARQTWRRLLRDAVKAERGGWRA